MKKIGLLFLMVFAGLFLFGCENKELVDDSKIIEQGKASEDYSQYQSKVSADKIQLYLFRGTIKCWTCITLGELTLKTLDESFSEEVKSGKITYEDINAELQENQFLAQKFVVRNISLYINTIVGNSESYEQQVNLMRYLNNEDQFKQMLKEKLDGLLSK